MPRDSACSPWVGGDAVASLPSVQTAIASLSKAGRPPSEEFISITCAESALAATEILYKLSGRQYSGSCGPVTVRPMARPTDADTRAVVAGFGGLGWSGSWGLCASYGINTGVASHYGCSNPPEIDLGVFPVTEIIQVKIDGVIIPSDEYELRDHKTLVRMRPTDSFSPTERWGWPTCQINDLPDTQPGTFSVTYDFGQPPPESGKIAVKKLAEFLALPQFGDTTRYPTRLTSISRQGVSASVVDVMDILKTGSLGIYEVDAFLLAVNPGKNRKQATVWSPDMARVRRTANPSI